MRFAPSVSSRAASASTSSVSILRCTLLSCHALAWEDYVYWQQTDKVMLRRLNTLIKEIQRTPFEGIGKPEPLKGDLSGYWSRRIDAEHRIVYGVERDDVLIAQCRGHYND
jgi:toxin YoeB